MYKLLFLCTGNSCRSILGEALINHLAPGRFKAYSAGSSPAGIVNPNALIELSEQGISDQIFSSQSWHDFAEIKIDMVISVCDNAAGEVCPIALQSALRAHWGLPDPAAVSSSEMAIKQAFTRTFHALDRRVDRLLALPFERLSDLDKVSHVNAIGQLTD
ncbi:MAG: arsenate reductase ArsC [Methyloprofundus sp.]|nr:arsenate reductase ArsC [Methyloprofundus sp.]